MKILVSAMALAIALAWPNAGEAQSKKAKARSATTTQQQYVRHAKVNARRDREAMRRPHVGRLPGLGSRPECAHDDSDGCRPRRPVIRRRMIHCT